jgi:hypothetical protein
MWRERIEEPVFAILLVLFLFAVFYVPYYIVGNILRPRFGVSSLRSFPLLSVFSVIGALFLLLIPITFGTAYSKLGKRFITHSTITAIWFLLGFILCSAYIYYLVFTVQHEDASLSEQLALIGSFGVMSFLASGMLVLYASDFLESRFDHRTKLMFPAAVIVDRLVDILYLMETKSNQWPEIEFRRELLVKINQTAACIERHLYQSLITNDAIMNGKIEETCARIATDLRATASSVVFSRKDTEENFKSYMTKCLLCAVRSEWGSMKQTKPRAIPRPQELRTRAKAILTGVLSASIPFVALVYLRRFNIVDSQLAGYFTAASVAWAALSLIAQIDPDYRNKLSALDKIRQLSKPGKSAE